MNLSETLTDWLSAQPKKPAFKLTAGMIEGIGPNDLQHAVNYLVARGHLVVTRHPIGSIYVSVTELGADAFWGDAG